MERRTNKSVRAQRELEERRRREREEDQHYELCEILRSAAGRSPRDLYEELEEHGYRGQDAARKTACLMAYLHVQRLCAIHLEGKPPATLPTKQNLLFLGPTGCGKTHLFELLFNEILGLACLVVDATTLSETGYVGVDVVSIVSDLIEAAGGSVPKAQAGIVCIDEFDKLASGRSDAVFSGAQTTKDVTGHGVQRELLKLLENTTVPLRNRRKANPFEVRKELFSTRDMAIVAAGAFSGLSAMAERSSIGFWGKQKSNQKIAVSMEKNQVRDLELLQKYGFMPELIGRFQALVPFAALDRDALQAILVANHLPKYRSLFACEGIDLWVEDSFLEYAVDQAMARQTGARGLSVVLRETLEEIAYTHFGDRDSCPDVVKLGMLDGKPLVTGHSYSELEVSHG